jgi:hypothetical protein
VGFECKPGQARVGTLLHAVESAIKGKLETSPYDDDLESMVKFVEGLELVRQQNGDPCPYYVAKCIKHFKGQLFIQIAGTSSASRTNPSEAGSSLSDLDVQSGSSNSVAPGGNGSFNESVSSIAIDTSVGSSHICQKQGLFDKMLTYL